MESRRWFNPSQPQTLQIAVFLLYINAFFMVVFGGFLYPFGLATIIGGAAGAYGIANEKRWGYNLGIAVALLPFVWRLANGGADRLLDTDAVTLLFEIALVALLVHPHSRDYQRIWFN